MAAVLSEAAQMDHWKTIVLTVPAHSTETEAAAPSEPSEVLAAKRIAIAIAVDSAVAIAMGSEIAIAVDSEADLPQTADHPMASPLVLLLQTAVRLVEIVAAVLSEAEAVPTPVYAVLSEVAAAMVPVRLAAVLPAARAATAAEAISVEEDRDNLRKMEN